MFEDETPLFCADDVFDDEPVPLELDVLDDEPLEPVPLDDVLDEPFEVLLLDVVPLDDVLPLLEADVPLPGITCCKTTIGCLMMYCFHLSEMFPLTTQASVQVLHLPQVLRLHSVLTQLPLTVQVFPLFCFRR